MEPIITCLTQIKAETKQKRKREILEQYSSPLVKETVRFLQDPTPTGITNQKLSQYLPHEVKNIISWGELMEYLKKNNKGTRYDVKVCQNFLDSKPLDDRYVYQQLITKKYRLDFTGDVTGNLFESKNTEPMLPTRYVSRLFLRNDNKFYVRPKVDGIRAVYLDGLMIDTHGRVYPRMGFIADEIKSVIGTEYVLDGYLTCKVEEGETNDEALYKSRLFARREYPKKDLVYFMIYDIVPRDEFVNRISGMTYTQRQKQLLELSPKLEAQEHLYMARSVYEGSDKRMIYKLIKAAPKYRWEGIFINRDDPYKCGHTYNMFYVPTYDELDLECVGMTEGTGQYARAAGGLEVRYGNEKLVITYWQNDDNRELYWNNPRLVLGKKVIIGCRGIYECSNGRKLLQYPRFVRVVDED